MSTRGTTRGAVSATSSDRGRRRAPVPSISAVPASLSADQARRTRTYLVQMGIRIACFVGAVAARGSWLTWVLVAAAVILPYSAVLFANAGPGRAHYDSSPVDGPAPDRAPAPMDTIIPGPTSPALSSALSERGTMSQPEESATTANDEPLICSGKGCRAQAVWALLWNNPKIHEPARRKVWLACDDHRDHLETFLGARSFLKETVPVGELPDPS